VCLDGETWTPDYELHNNVKRNAASHESSCSPLHVTDHEQCSLLSEIRFFLDPTRQWPSSTSNTYCRTPRWNIKLCNAVDMVNDCPTDNGWEKAQYRQQAGLTANIILHLFQGWTSSFRQTQPNALNHTTVLKCFVTEACKIWKPYQLTFMERHGYS